MILNDFITYIGALLTLPPVIYGVVRFVFNKYKKMRYYNYCKEISSRNFFEWKLDIIQQIFPNDTFISMFGVKYPVVTINSTHEKYPFNILESESKLRFDERKEKKYTKYQNFYRNLLSPVVKRPNNIGYALKNFNYNNDGNIVSIDCFPCSFEQNLKSSFYLEYELYINYKKNKADKTINNIKYPERFNFVQNRDIKQILNSNNTHDSMLSVQCFMVFKDRYGIYNTILSKRSKKVSYSPNSWQIIPCGYFETYEKSNTNFIIQNNFKPSIAVIRELLEEVFNEKEFIKNEDGQPIQRILNHNAWLYIEKMITDNKADFVFLGSVYDLVTMTNKLSYILIIDDIEFSKMDFYPNFETKDMQIVSINKIQSVLGKELLMPETAGLLDLTFKFLEKYDPTFIK